MKVGLAQINTTVGDFSGNRERILRAYRELVASGAELVVFPELVITGYPPRDLLFKSRFVPDNLECLTEIAQQVGEIPAVIGYVDRSPNPAGRPLINAAAWCENGEVAQSAAKCLLPTYDVFDEDRYFAAAESPTVIEWKGLRVALTICEDIWTGPIVETSKHYAVDPLEQLAAQKPDLLINLSASPWHHGKDAWRRNIVSVAAQRVGAPVIYVNSIGGNDELIFDGQSMVVTAEGKLIQCLSAFEEALGVVDLETSDATVDIPQVSEIEQTYAALVLGVRDYAHKCGFRKALIGLSGGIDSALTAVIAADALGRENVIGVSLPSDISSQHSRDDAASLAANLGIGYHVLPIAEVVASANASLGPIFEGLSADVTEENIQARSRGLLLMALSNKFNALLLTTGNKSEISVGYCTLYGDMCGGLAVISDLPKTRVFEVCRWLNRETEVIPWNTINKPPSAELRPDQKDEDSLPPYDVLDAILRLYVEEGKSRNEIVEAGFAREVVNDVVRKVDLNEYKRKQAAPGLKISPLAFGVGRRIPIVQKYVG